MSLYKFIQTRSKNRVIENRVMENRVKRGITVVGFVAFSKMRIIELEGTLRQDFLK